MSIINFYESLNIENYNIEFIKENIHLLKVNIDTEKCINIMLQFNNYDKSIFKIVMLDLLKVNDRWINSDNYVCNFNNIKYMNDRAKFIGSRKDLINLKVEAPPEIILGDKNNIEFVNGRNRFANLRDLGVSHMPFIIHKKEYSKIINSCV